ncbi:MAG: antitoxin [Euryarchaeota archaeon]|nr:antitoxin [Euryarchaeota archaeon]
MGVKTISVNDEVYRTLAQVKRADESFSDLIRRLLSAKGASLKDYFGALKDSKCLDGIDEHVRAVRSSAKVRG